MDKLLYLAGPLSCAVMMALMMWLMRGRHTGAGRDQPVDRPQPTTRR
jgi:hypothetical protein